MSIKRLGLLFLRYSGIVFMALLWALALCFVTLFVIMRAHLLQEGRFYISALAISKELVIDPEAGGYSLSEKGKEQLYRTRSFVFVLGPDGSVEFSENAPEALPYSFSAGEIAAFSKWYWRDIPVEERVLDDGMLLVVGSPLYKTAKYNLTWPVSTLNMMLFSFPAVFIIILINGVRLTGKYDRREAARRDEDKSRWIDGVSHDIRTPLSVITGRAEEFAGDVTLPKKRRDEASQILNAGLSVKRLVSDLNLTMRLNDGLILPRRDRFAVLPLIRETVAELINSGSISGERVIELPCAETDNTKPQELDGDRLLIKRTLENLILNADRHGEAGSPILIQAEEDRKRTAITVENKILSAPADNTLNGSGLDLVRRIVSAHGGHFDISLRNNGDELTLAAKMSI